VIKKAAEEEKHVVEKVRNPRNLEDIEKRINEIFIFSNSMVVDEAKLAKLANDVMARLGDRQLVSKEELLNRFSKKLIEGVNSGVLTNASQGAVPKNREMSMSAYSGVASIGGRRTRKTRRTRRYKK